MPTGWLTFCWGGKEKSNTIILTSCMSETAQTVDEEGKGGRGGGSQSQNNPKVNIDKKGRMLSNTDIWGPGLTREWET